MTITLQVTPGIHGGYAASVYVDPDLPIEELWAVLGVKTDSGNFAAFAPTAEMAVSDAAQRLRRYGVDRVLLHAP